MKTYWNGERARCRCVVVRVAESDERTPPLAWYRGLEGTERRAVEVNYGKQAPFYLDDDEVPAEVYERSRAARAADPKMRALIAALPRNERNDQPGRAGDGWEKVTTGRGSPEWGHRAIPVAEVLREVPPWAP